jgi:hypothetical protein
MKHDPALSSVRPGHRAPRRLAGDFPSDNKLSMRTNIDVPQQDLMVSYLFK